MKQKKAVAGYDSATQILNATTSFFHGKDISSHNVLPKPVVKHVLLPLLRGINGLPKDIRKQTIGWIGTTEALAQDKASQIDSEKIASYLIKSYPQKKYQSIAIGSTNGALTHLYAALQTPWLPQTFLTLIKRDVQAKNLTQDLDFGKEQSNAIRKKNDILSLYQMHDPMNDQSMVNKMAYFRMKFRKLPKAYKDFLQDRLKKNGTIIIINCKKKWPVATISKNHSFQVGGLGDITPEEYYDGGKMMKKSITPEPTDTKSEAEWGYDEELTSDILTFAKKHNYTVKELQFIEPSDISPLIADFYRWWYAKLERPTNRLFFENFMLLDSYQTIKNGLIPYWVPFNDQSSYQSAKRYLSKHTFDYIYLTLFSNFVKSNAKSKLSVWKDLLKAAKKQGHLLGVDEEKFPFDMASTAQFYFDLKKSTQADYHLPQELPLQSFTDFLQQNKQKYKNISMKTIHKN